MQFLRVSFLFMLVAFCSVAYGDKACQIRIKYLGLAHNADACKAKCAQFGPSCVVWGHETYSERCTGYIMERDEENTSHTSYSSASFYGSSGFHYCGVVASPNITTPADFLGTSCGFSLVELGTHYQEQMCGSACQNLESNVYGGCAAWMWAKSEKRCVGLLVSSSYDYSKCGAP